MNKKTSSCSMVLRSACTHRHSRESSTVKDHLHISSYQKSKCASTVSKEDSCNGSLHLESSLESPVKQLTLKSAEKTYSLLKGQFYENFEISDSANQKFFESSSLNVSCAKELHFSQLSSGWDSSSINSRLILRECSSDYSSAAESDINSSESLDPTSNMSKSKSQRYTRSSVSAVRSLSGSEDESDIRVENISRPRKNFSTNTDFRGRRNMQAGERANNLYLPNNSGSHLESHQNANNHTSRYAGSSDGDSLLSRFTESSHMERSSVQYSLFDRFRWFLWRCIYLKIIRNVNFDVLFLSRINNYGKLKAVFILSLPVLLFLVWGIIQYNVPPNEAVFETLNSAMSPILSFISSLFSSFKTLCTQPEEKSTSPDSSEGSCFSDLTILSSISSLYASVSGWLTTTKESASPIVDMDYQPKELLYHQDEDVGQVNQLSDQFQSSREELKIVASEVLKDEINSLRAYVKSTVQIKETDKLERERKLQNEILNLRQEFKSLSGAMGKLEEDIVKQSIKRETNEKVIPVISEYKNHIDHLNFKLRTIEAKLDALEHLRTCCDKQWSEDDFLALLEKHLILAFKNVVDGDTQLNSKYSFFSQWLNAKFFNHEKLTREINAALKRHSSSQSDSKLNFDKVVQIVESTVLKHVDSIKKNFSEFSKSDHSSFSRDIFSEDKVKKIVKEAIMLYDADKTGRVDYALESGGGSVLGTRCSETYVEKYGKLSILGFPIWTNSNSPRTAIQPDVQPGRCWAFKGSHGFLVIELSATIYPTGFTLEHIPISLSPSGTIDSAPKNFSVLGLESEKDNKGNLLGEYWYDVNGDPLQYFAVKKPSEKPYSHIELQIHSNHGNMDYTCLYRFRVHGQRVR